MHDRHQQLLATLIRTYIATGKPVSSGALTEAVQPPVSSATIRNIVRELEEAGYLMQPHTSAGRIPADKGYRWYINDLVQRDVAQYQYKHITDNYSRFISQHAEYQAGRSLAHFLADSTQTTAASGIVPGNDVYGVGLSRLVSDNPETAQEVSEFFDTLESYLPNLLDMQNQDVHVYIGSENPIASFNHTSMIIKNVQLADGRTCILCILGPKRMPYARNMAVLDAIASYLS